MKCVRHMTTGVVMKCGGGNSPKARDLYPLGWRRVSPFFYKQYKRENNLPLKRNSTNDKAA